MKNILVLINVFLLITYFSKAQTTVDCNAGPVNEKFCYQSNTTTELTYLSNDNTPLNIRVNSGNVEDLFDEFIVIDSDGTELYNAYGNNGDLTGLSFQSSGNKITIQVVADSSEGCETSNDIAPIDITVSCLTCTNPDVNYLVVANCENNKEEFSVEVEIEDLGSANTLDITSNQGDSVEAISMPSTLTFGPYALGTNVVFTVNNVDDANCSLISPNQTLVSCACFIAEPFCSPGQEESLVFENVFDGSSAPDIIDYDCLLSQPNPVWFFLQVQDSGSLDFEIVQNTQFSEQGNPTGTPLDVDFIAWGPFDNASDACKNLSLDTQIDCSFSPEPTEKFNITNAKIGDVYIVLITNFNGEKGFISLGQTNSGDFGSGSTNCDIVLQNQVTICENEKTELQASDLQADQYQWLRFNEGTGEYEPIEGEESASLTISEPGLYEVLIIKGTERISEEINVKYIPEPEHNLPSKVSLDSEEEKILDASAINQSEYNTINYRWFLNGNQINGGIGAKLEVKDTGNYSVEVTTRTLNVDAFGKDVTCVSQFNVQVVSQFFTLDLGGNQTFCDENAQTITASVTGADASSATYEWSTGETTPSIEVETTGKYEVSVTIDGVTETESVTYTFNESPIIALGPDAQTCDLNEFTLNATPSNAEAETANYSWSLNGIDLEQNTATINPSDFGYGEYQVNVFFENPDCSSSDSIILSLRDDITVDITSDDEDNKFCPDESVTFTANVENANIAEVDFEWFVNGVSQNINNSVLENLELDNISSPVDIRVEARIGQDCLFTNSLNLSFYDIDSCVISQGLSPNGDGMNDKLDLRFLDDRSGISSLEVFNRYGQKVYEKANYRDEFFGQSDSGNNLVTGTYFYVIKFDREDPIYGVIKKGWIYINREQ